jgi:hypothetical protein
MTPVEKSTASCTDIKIRTGDLLFIVVPVFVAELIRIIPKIIALPCRYLSDEPPMPEKKSPSNERAREDPDIRQMESRGTLDSELTEVDIYFPTDDEAQPGDTATDAAVTPIKEQYQGSLLSGANMRISLKLYNVSQVFLMNGADLDQGSLELYVKNVNLTVTSDPDHEKLEVDIGDRCDNALRLTSCRVYSWRGSGQAAKGVYIHTLPLKEAFVLDSFRAYGSREIVALRRDRSEKYSDSSVASHNVASDEATAQESTTSAAGERTHAATYDISGSVSLSVGNFVANITPTFTAFANGVATVRDTNPCHFAISFSALVRPPFC